MSSGFNMTERIEKRNGVVTKHDRETRCSECNQLLESADDWSRHQRIHTPISKQTYRYYNPVKAPK